MADPTSFDTWLAQAWNDHGENPQVVAERLATSLSKIEISAHVVPYARLVTHVYGEHLGWWQRGIDLLESIRNCPANEPTPDLNAALLRNVQTLRYASGNASCLHQLADDDQIVVLATASAALAGRNEHMRALQALADALARAQTRPLGAAAVRALAIAGNNVAASLEEKAGRDEHETQGMVDAAQTALQYWRLAGTWLEEERALYRLARSLLAAGELPRAVDAALGCLGVCRAHAAPPLELFFAYAALSVACRGQGAVKESAEAREQALRQFALIPMPERVGCDETLAWIQA